MPRRGVNTKSPRLTYSRQRSLAEHDGNVLDLGDTSSDSEPAQSLPSPAFTLSPTSPGVGGLKRSRSSRSSLGLHDPISRTSSQSSLSKRENNEQRVALKASHELRESGQSHRFRDEMDYTLEGVRNKDKLKIRRVSCLELAKSMLKQEFLIQIRTHHYMPKVFEAIREDRDPVVLSCLVLMITLVIQDSRESLKSVIAIPRLVEFLCQGLDEDMDPMAILPSGKQDVMMYNDFKDLARQSGILEKGQKVLTKSIILSSLNAIINECVFKKDFTTMTAIDRDPDFLNLVIEILIDDLAWIKEPSSSPGASLPDVLDIARIENCLRILERLSLISKKPSRALAGSVRLFTLLSQLIILCRAHAFQYPQRKESINLILHTLRLLINVTNGSEPCCERLAESGALPILVQNIIQFYGHCRNFNPDSEDEMTQQNPNSNKPDGRIQWTAQPSESSGSELGHISQLLTPGDTIEDPIESRSDDETPSILEIQNDANGWYDILLLSIGLMINILEVNQRHREQVVEQAISLDCKALGDCFHEQCRCEKSTDALERLVGVYNVEVTISELTENQVLAAYLALLLGCIVDGSQEREGRLYLAAEGQTLVPMLELLKSFIDFNQSIMEEHQGQQEPQGDMSHPTLSQEQQQLQYQEGSSYFPSFSPSSSLSRANSFMTLTLDDNELDVTMASPLFSGTLSSAPSTFSSLSSLSPPASPPLSLKSWAPSSLASSAMILSGASTLTSTAPVAAIEKDAISFNDIGSSSADETRKSFLRIIDVLQSAEDRHSSQD
ncbi:hypothetical protein EMPS_06081 [Entomortierella parvispora]|uniref:Wings apart-like protein C-terminal domain-containing protein n=1 Tax=Entomortierella parvispora TaxID=205924 RepID=A0A9P3HC35_9FUNG|nr:hypothetical protein EMPS_06081 [Entomortierella parvispora]